VIDLALVGELAIDARVELLRAMELFAPMHSPHEGIAVIHEEFIELQKHVYGDTGRTNEARDEAIQLAAMALRYVYDLSETP
jgi:hypothetical protein